MVLEGLRSLFGMDPPGMRRASVRCANPLGLHRIAWTEWGDEDNPDVLVCVHGLTRNARDFDDLARALASEFRVVCPDVAGRGRSDWLPNPAFYALPQYVSDMIVLIARLGVEHVHWLGTSLGGLIGMLLAAQKDSPISRLVLNDVGPVLSAAAIKRIGDYVGRAPKFADYAAAEAYIRTISAPFGPLTDAQWQHLTESSLRAVDGGGYEIIYDPAIAMAFAATPAANVELWPLYDAIRCPTLVVRGAESDLLARDTFDTMAQRGPRAKLLEIAGVGHAPMLLDEQQIAPVRAFLMEN